MKKRPNILFILTDDQGYWSLGSYGNNEIKTPNLDRLAQNGMRFNNFFCASPVCSPARASIITGRIPSAHGVHDWINAGGTYHKNLEPNGDGKVIEYLKGIKGYTDVLAENGYECALSGKWHLGDCHHSQKGFSWWKPYAVGGNYFNAPMIDGDNFYNEPRYVTDVFTDNAIEFLETRDHDKSPFYLSVHYTAPHTPWGRDQHPTEVFDDYYNNCAFESVPDALTPPEWVKQLNIPVDSPEQRRAYLSGYYAAVQEMDRNVGRIIKWLEQRSMLENTVIFFCSDNGMCMGHHGVYGKGNATLPINMFEESVKVPFIVSMPGVIPDGVAHDGLFSQYDFMPTLLDWLGMPLPDDPLLPGRSFASLLDGQDIPGGDAVFVGSEYGPVRMIREQRWKYIKRYEYGLGPDEMYDLENDPDETDNLADNLADNEEYTEEKDRLSKKLDTWFEEHTNPILNGSKCPVQGKGQIGQLTEGCNPVDKFNYYLP